MLGHEIAHSIAHHTAERLSRFAIMLPLAFLMTSFFDISDKFMNIAINMAWELPASRKQEVMTH